MEIIYRASDGKEFYDKKECRSYEKNLEKKESEIYKKILEKIVREKDLEKMDLRFFRSKFV